MWVLTLCIVPVSGWGVWVNHGASSCSQEVFKTQAHCERVLSEVERERDRLWNQESYNRSLARYATCSRSLV